MFNVLKMLKLELGNKEYFTDEEFTGILMLHNLSATDTYTNTMKKQLYEAALDVLEKIMNNSDYMRKLETEFGTQGDAYKNLEKQVDKIKDKIIEIEDEEAGKENKSVFMMYYTNEI
ncbi:hypothetical protein [Clostridium brassicae]|uniref:Phage protein n=1 Tax=Clostridium brassicae TaxID=2999072 RepID=A0ABT4D7J9_9CLOT|nr:hypothetical protein [Clostridium brassicae]MCY6958274.1 hypothetical protein [Clostridium brassicae]